QSSPTAARPAGRGRGRRPAPRVGRVVRLGQGQPSGDGLVLRGPPPRPDAGGDRPGRPGPRRDRGARGPAHRLSGGFRGQPPDRAAAVVRARWWPTPDLLHGGQSSLYALGSPPGNLGGRWEVALRNPFDASTPVGTIRLRDRALGTSGASFQRFEADGRVYGHILDPRTGEPAAAGPASVTVLAPTAADADALSTAFYLLGPEATAAYVAAHPEVG